MERLTPIPTAWSVRWQEFRRIVIPAAAFLVVLVATVLLWDQTATGNISGLAEADASLVSAPQNAVIERLLVEPSEIVQAGQALAVLAPADPRTAFDLWQAELALGRLRAEPTIAEGNAMNFERFRAELLRLRTELDVARVNLQRAEREVARYEPLHTEKLLSDDVFELSVSARDALQAEVASKERVIGLLEQRAEALRPLGVPDASPASDQQLAMQQLERLRAAALTNLAPVTLFAPRAGMVQGLYRRGGEHVVVGELLFNISPLRSDRIVGYLRQPYPVAIEPGLRVDVVTRERPRRHFTSEISQVGARLEVITNSLAFVRPNALVDSGLPFVVPLPADISLRPGEIVDLRVHEDGASPSAAAASRRVADSDLSARAP